LVARFCPSQALGDGVAWRRPGQTLRQSWLGGAGQAGPLGPMRCKKPIACQIGSTSTTGSRRRVDQTAARVRPSGSSPKAVRGPLMVRRPAAGRNPLGPPFARPRGRPPHGGKGTGAAAPGMAGRRRPGACRCQRAPQCATSAVRTRCPRQVADESDEPPTPPVEKKFKFLTFCLWGFASLTLSILNSQN